MTSYVHIQKNRYIDSLETLFATSVLCEQPGISVGLVGMGTPAFKTKAQELSIESNVLEGCSGVDTVITALAESEEAFIAAVAEVIASGTMKSKQEERTSYRSIAEAKQHTPAAQLCSIAVPGEYALSEVKKALELGMHCVVFSNNVPLEDERTMKELAIEKGLLCMGPDCGVANINGAALVLSSINNRGPFGICGASGCGIQHVAAILHDAGSGVSQALGTGGNDLKEAVGGLMMLAGIDVLEADKETESLILISRKPADSILDKLLDRISRCNKPRVVYFMGCNREDIEKTGAIWAENLDDCAQKALGLIGKHYPLESEADIQTLATKAAGSISTGQRYLRGLFSGGTYMDEAMRALQDSIGGIHSNSPLEESLRLEDSYQSVEHSCVDYGEEEFTLGRLHPAMDPSIRCEGVLREIADPQTAVVLLDFILTPPGHSDPTGYLLEALCPALEVAEQQGRHVAVVASVLGTDADFQNVNTQRQQLRDAGVIVCKTNYIAARVAGAIIQTLKGVKS